MELFGIILSIPMAVIASTAYIALIKLIVAKLPRLAPSLVGAGIAILAIFAIENILLTTIGAVRSRETIGPVFYRLHLAVFVLGVLAFANLLVLRGRERMTTTLAVTLCAIFALVLVLEQYSVSEALFGID